MRRHLPRPLVMPLAVTAIGAAVLTMPNVTNASFAPETPAPNAAQLLITAHDCWTGAAPLDMAGRLPGHVVVTIDGQARYAGPRMVGRALGHVFNGTEPNLTVNGFCR